MNTGFNLIKPQHFRTAIWLFFYALTFLQLLWYGLWVPARLPFAVAITIALLPLLPGLMAHWCKSRYALIWAGFGVLAHFTFAAMEVWIAGANRSPAIVSSFLCCGYFLCWNFVVVGEKRAKKLNASEAFKQT